LIKAVDAELQSSSGILGLIALISSLFFGSQLFIVLETCFSVIYRVRSRPLIRQQVVAIAMFLLFLLLVPLMVFAASMPALALFPLYATYFLTSVPGVVGLFALLLIFFYYFAVILLLGAEVNAFFVEGVRPMSNDLVAFATIMQHSERGGNAANENQHKT